MTTAAAVEAAARALCEVDAETFITLDSFDAWDTRPDNVKAHYRKMARAALAAAESEVPYATEYASPTPACFEGST